MNRTFLIMCVIIILSSCIANKSPKTGVEIHVRILNKLDPNNFKRKEGVYYSVSIDLTNNTDTVFNYCTSSCSWENNWIFNMDSIGIVRDLLCDKNDLLVKRINPKQKITYYVVIHSSLKQIKENEYKLGLILIKENEISNLNEFYEVFYEKFMKKKDIIWSETFKIKK